MTGLAVRLYEAARLDEKQAAVLPLERRLVRRLARTWAAQHRKVAATLTTALFEGAAGRLAEAMNPDDIERAADAVRADRALVETLDAVLVEAAGRGARDSGAELGAKIAAAFALENPAAVQWLSERAATQVAGIDDVTRGYVRTILTQAADQGWSYQRTSRALRERFVGFSARSRLGHVRNRGELIAITEVGTAYEHAGTLVAAQLVDDGLVIEKAWLTAADAKVCPVCAPAGSEGWISEADSFTNGLAGPLGHPGCRCTTTRRAALTEDE